MTRKVNCKAFRPGTRPRSKQFDSWLQLSPKCILLSILCFAVGCGHLSFRSGSTSAGFTSPSTPALSISGDSEVRASTVAIYRASVTGLNNGAVHWYVNHIPNGNSQVGTISDDGVFTAPAAAGSAVISCVSLQDPTVTASLPVSISNPVPSVSSVFVSGVLDGAALITIEGSGFISQSRVTASGTLLPVSFVSSNELRTVAALGEEPSETSIVVSNPDPGAADSAKVNALLPPSRTTQLSGCDNPNTPVSKGEWGADVDAAYIPLTNRTGLIGTPLYTSNSIFWTSGENTPGTSILMTGAFTAAPKSAKIAVIPPGTSDWKSLVASSGETTATRQQGTTALSFVIPEDLPQGVYGFELSDPTAASIYGSANQPQLDWIIGVPREPAPIDALKLKVHTCAAERDGNLRIFGRNFIDSSRVILESASGVSYLITPSEWNPTALTAHVPVEVQPGTYYLWVGNSQWDVTASPMTIISILDVSAVKAEEAACNSLVADGRTDNSGAFQECLDTNAPREDGQIVKHVRIPGGDIVISSGISLRPFEVLEGSTEQKTRIIGRGALKGPWVTLPQHSGLSNLAISAPDGSPAVGSLGCRLGYPENTGHLYLDHVAIDSLAVDGLTAKTLTLDICGPDIQIYNSQFSAGTFSDAFSISFGDGTIFQGNKVDTGNGTLGLEQSQNSIVERNEFTSAAFPSIIGNTAIATGRAFWHYGPSMVSRNLYIGSNFFHDMGSHTNDPVIATDGGGGAYYGGVASSTATSVTLSDDPNWRWLGVTYPQSAFAVVVKGTGAGEYSPVQSWQGRTVAVAKPWIVPPDSTSWLEIVAIQTNLSVVQNSFIDTINNTIELGDIAETIIEDNTLVNSGNGIITRAYGPYGGPTAFGPVIDTEVLRNTTLVGKGNYIEASHDAYRRGIGVFDGYGCISSGQMIRENTLPAIQTLYDTNGVNGINGVVVEHNIGRWQFTKVDQFLIQDNIAP